MTYSASTATEILTAAREGIDHFDTLIHDALMKRAGLVENVMNAKRLAGMDLTPLRPAREMMILRRLLARHSGSLPPEALADIWRQIISSATAMQAPMTISLVQSSDPALWLNTMQLAMTHFGGRGVYMQRSNGRDMLEDLMTGISKVGIVPAEELINPKDSWWHGCLNASPAQPKIVGALPQIAKQPKAYIIARAPIEPTEDDTTLIGVDISQPFDAQELNATLQKLPQRPQLLSYAADTLLLALPGYHYYRHGLEDLANQLHVPLQHCQLAGIYANPVDPNSLARHQESNT